MGDARRLSHHRNGADGRDASIFVKTLFTALHITMVPNTILIYFIVSCLAAFLSMRDIRLSSRVGLTLEAISMVIIGAVTIAALATKGFHSSTPASSR